MAVFLKPLKGCFEKLFKWWSHVVGSSLIALGTGRTDAPSDHSPVAQPLLDKVLLARSDVGLELVEERDLPWVKHVPTHIVNLTFLVFPQADQVVYRHQASLSGPYTRTEFDTR